MAKVNKVKDTSGKNKQKEQTFVFSSSEFYFDDCPICQAMKKAEEEGRELSEKELREAFTKANEEQKNKGN